jgi:AraC-like DNA-binding protein
MQHQEFEPPKELRDIIKCFWYNRRDLGELESSFEVLPDGYAEIIFHFGSGCSISGNGILQPLPSPFMVGLLNQPVLLNAKNRLEIIGIRCFPWTVFDLLGLPSSKDRVRVFKHPIAQLHATLNKWVQAGRIEEALTEIKLYFLNEIAGKAFDGVLFKAGGVMRETRGTLPVNQVAAAAHATVRTLERKFKQASGHTVKDVSGLMRFEQARNQLWLNPDSSIADLAHKLGYTDQAHLSREFKRYSGTTPAAFARKAKKRKEAVDNDFVAFIQA